MRLLDKLMMYGRVKNKASRMQCKKLTLKKYTAKHILARSVDVALNTSEKHDVLYYLYSAHNMYMKTITCVHVFSALDVATKKSTESTTKPFLSLKYLQNFQ